MHAKTQKKMRSFLLLFATPLVRRHTGAVALRISAFLQMSRFRPQGLREKAPETRTRSSLRPLSFI